MGSSQCSNSNSMSESAKKGLVVIIIKHATTSKVFWSWIMTDFDFLSPMNVLCNSSVILNSNFYSSSEMHSTKTNKFESNFRVRNHFEIWNSKQRKPTIIHFKYWFYAHYQILCVWETFKTLSITATQGWVSNILLFVLSLICPT